MVKEVRIAIIGLGRVGSTFLQKLTQQRSIGVKIVGAVEARQDAPGVKVAEERNIRVYRDIQDVVRLGDAVDVIFDLTGSNEVRRALRSGMAETNNRHTVVAPEVVAFLIWELIAAGEAFPETHAVRGY
jgi:homoserine dehydrogenase